MLALWVGGLITVALVKTKVKDTDDIKSLGKVNSVHKFLADISHFRDRTAADTCDGTR